MGVAVVLLVGISFSPIFALTDLERISIDGPRLENAVGNPLVDNINVNQQIQISADITNQQAKLQNFAYIVQIKDETERTVAIGWITGQLTSNQRFNPSLSWIPRDEGEYSAEVFVWDWIKDNKGIVSQYDALTDPVSITFKVS